MSSKDLKKHKRKICIISGTRAEYGLLRNLIRAIDSSNNFELQIIATGMHLEKKYGYTYKEIELDNFIINKKLDLELISDTPLGISRSTSIGLKKFSEALSDLKPDLVLILGDRFEILSAAIACMFLRIPIGHIHGGELTEGCIDEAIRHSITKLSHLHFVAAEEYKNRVIQLGENPKRVFKVGGMGVDSISRLKLLSKDKLESALNIKFQNKNLLITYHPVTLENSTSKIQMRDLLKSLGALEDTFLLFTMPNADTDSDILFKMIKEFVNSNKNAQAFSSLGQLKYFSCIKYVDGVIGNSSSGLTEVPTFNKGTINIGDRQRGRLMAKSVINCDPNFESINSAIKLLYSDKFQNQVLDTSNPYGKGRSVPKIMEILKKTTFDDLIKKSFHDLNIN